MPKVEGVLLDVDGTLLDSNDAHANAWVRSLAEIGVEVPFDRVRRLIGKGGDKVLPEISGIDLESAQGKKLSKRRGEIFKADYLPSLRGFPKAKELLERMKADGLHLVVATSAQKGELAGLLRAAGVHPLIEDAATSDDAEESKPDPDIVLAALARLKLPAERVLFLGDTPYDVEAGVKAGVAVVALRCGGWETADLKGATAVYDSPADLLANYDRSPFGRRE